MVTSAQLRAARALLNWTVRDLAEESGVHRNTVTRAENEQGEQGHAVAQIVRTLEAAGVEFTNGGQQGVRMKNANAFTHIEFLQGVRRYENDRLPAKATHVHLGVPQFGFSFEYPDENNVALMLKGREIGRATWRNGIVFFDPDFRPDGPALEPMLDKWIARSDYRRVTTGG